MSPNEYVASASSADTTTRGQRSSHKARASSSDSAARSWRTCFGGGSTARINSSAPDITRIRLRAAEKDMVTVYSLIVIAPAGGGLVPVGNRRGRITRPLRFRAKRKFIDTHIRHAAAPGLGAPQPPSSDVVTVIESSFLTALMARVGRSTSARPPRGAATRAVKLPPKIPAANEEGPPAKPATQLI